jgi:hypothetical protein
MKYKLRPAKSLFGPRVYSTDLNPRTLDRKVDPVFISRSLKVKLITKGVVTINGGHLVNPPAFDFVRQNPILLTDGLLLPAIREDKGDFQAYIPDYQPAYDVAGWPPVRVDEAMSFLGESVKTVLPWKVEEAQEQYRKALLWGLMSDKSIARKRLLKVESVAEKSLERLATDLSSADLSEDSVVDRLIAEEPEKARRIISLFAEGAYHLVGTSVVNCETGLDVSEFAQWRADHLLGDENYDDMVLLTDVNIFLRCCFETAMQVINETAFPDIVIDSLPFDAIGKMSVRLRDQGFQAAYDSVITTFTSRLVATNMEHIENWDPDSTVDLVSQLAKHFRDYFQEELKVYRKAIQEAKKEEAIRAGVATVKSSVGLVPGISEVLSYVDLGGAASDTFRAAGEAFAYRDHSVADAAARRKRDSMVDEALKKLSPKNESKILTALRQMRAISAEYQRPF